MNAKNPEQLELEGFILLWYLVFIFNPSLRSDADEHQKAGKYIKTPKWTTNIDVQYGV